MLNWESGIGLEQGKTNSCPKIGYLQYTNPILYLLQHYPFKTFVFFLIFEILYNQTRPPCSSLCKSKYPFPIPVPYHVLHKNTESRFFLPFFASFSSLWVWGFENPNNCVSRVWVFIKFEDGFSSFFLSTVMPEGSHSFNLFCICHCFWFLLLLTHLNGKHKQ